MIQPEDVPGYLSDLAPYLSLVCEGQIIDFSIRAGYGPWLKIRVPEPGLLEGLKPGQRFHVMMIHVPEDEMPASKDPEKRKPYRPSQMAGYLCNEPGFREFIAVTYGEVCHDTDEAAEWIRGLCGVRSRSELDSNPAAAETFRNMINEFDSWKRGSRGGGLICHD